MINRMVLTIALLWACTIKVSAQEDLVWIQIEARPTLSIAMDRARIYSSQLPDVNGFALTSGWYGIVLGPYSRSNADQVLRVYQSEGIIPNDAYISFSSSYTQQIWPVGANLLDSAASVPIITTQQLIAPETETSTIKADNETPAQARQSERQLSLPEREALQVALKWAGSYIGEVDGKFGRGTRNAMATWQEQKGLIVTGTLTSMQRADLLKDYNAVLEKLGMQTVRDDQAGIEIHLPLDIVSFEKYEYPFAHYSGINNTPAKILLISQTGDQNTLFGLYDIMQTLNIVPLNGPRELKENSFFLIGEDGQKVSETHVSLRDGQIKGFTVVWPAGDEERRRRLITIMETSLVRNREVLSPEVGSNEQAIDLIAGLKVRVPKISQSGFFIDLKGTVITSSKAVADCIRVTLEDNKDAEVIVLDNTVGIAVIKPSEPLAPLGVAEFSLSQPLLNTEVTASGYSFDGTLDAPSVTYGKLSDLRGLSGETNMTRLALKALPGDAGGPVLDPNGGVLGMLLPKPTSKDRSLPHDVNFVVNHKTLQEILAGSGMAGKISSSTTPIDALDLSKKAAGMTALVRCWD